METNRMTREEALRRFRASKERKRQRLAEMERELRRDLLERTGQSPKHFYAW